MSMQIKLAKAQGDPGLFGFLGKAVGTLTGVATSFIPGPVGAIARGLQSKVFGGSPTPSALPAARALPALRPGPQIYPSYAPAPAGLPVPYQQGAGSAIVMPSNGQVGVDATPAIGCPQGYKPNKSGYYRRIRSPGNPEGSVFYIHPKSRCVKIRKRNPANPRAADRAVSRIQSAKRFATKMNRITVRKKCD